MKISQKQSMLCLLLVEMGKGWSGERTGIIWKEGRTVYKVVDSIRSSWEEFLRIFVNSLLILNYLVFRSRLVFYSRQLRRYIISSLVAHQSSKVLEAIIN